MGSSFNNRHKCARSLQALVHQEHLCLSSVWLAGNASKQQLQLYLRQSSSSGAHKHHRLTHSYVPIIMTAPQADQHADMKSIVVRVSLV